MPRRHVDSRDLRIGKAVRAARFEGNLSLKELARRIGLSWQALQNIELGKTRISVVRLEDVATALDVPLTKIIGQDAAPLGDDEFNVVLSSHECAMVIAYRSLTSARLKTVLAQFVEMMAEATDADAAAAPPDFNRALPPARLAIPAEHVELKFLSGEEAAVWDHERYGGPTKCHAGKPHRTLNKLMRLRPGPEFEHSLMGRRVRNRREKLGISRAELAAIMGVSYQLVYKCETGGRSITDRRLSSFARALSVPTSYFTEPE